MLVNPLVMKNVPYDFWKDFALIGLIANAPHVLAVRDGLPAKSAQDLVAMAKASPGKYTIASSGVGTIVQMAAELLKHETGEVEDRRRVGEGARGMTHDVGAPPSARASTLQSFANLQSHISCGVLRSTIRGNVMDLRYAIRAAFAAGVFAAAPVIAADTFTTLDKNNDGNIDATEAAAQPWLQQGFSQFDTNHNGSLGKDEFAAAAKSPAATAAGATSSSATFDSLDKNHDGKLDPTEAAAVPGLQQGFSQYDTDHGGTLGKDEFAAAQSSLASAAAGASSSSSVTFDSLDKNNDGNIDPTEAAAQPWLQQNFSQYDTNHNGSLGKDEFAAAQKAHP